MPSFTPQLPVAYGNHQEAISSPRLKGWHAHICFNDLTEQTAQRVINDIALEITDLRQGQLHRKLVGPHPCWSCQLYFKPHLLSDVVTWLTFNRKGLTILFHPISGNDLLDHKDRVFWMGDVKDLKLENL
ncbi:4,5-dioxygenase [Vibrio splendidus]|nr:4,5-dioxygenase [Vibrio splendidus]URM15173.1 DOPA 4,5-dioxygenase family protein [Vibrio splendidus]